MKKLTALSVALLATAALEAQTIDEARKAIDAEQYDKAKKTLKTMWDAKPDGRVAFLLGNVYLKQDVADSAKIYFQKGLSASDNSKLNYIGLGQIELDNGNTAAAKTNFDNATKDIRKKDTEQLIAVARAYMNADKPDFKAALNTLNKAKLNNPNDPQVLLALGDAYYGDKNQNEAYAAYRSALGIDPSLVRAKLQQGVLLKGARAHAEAVKTLEGVKASNPSYGPVYRELAETYYLWGVHEPRKYNEYIRKALDYYEQYMKMTDYSLASRMRHADFLILAKDYKALEVEAEKMKQLDKVNPRILRYLGYSAYENGNAQVAIQSLNEFMSNPSNKVIARDHMYLGLAKLKVANNADGTINDALFTEGIGDIRKAVDLELTMTNELSEVGKRLFGDKKYLESSKVFEIAISNPDSRNYIEDILYYAITVHTVNRSLEQDKVDAASVEKASAGLDLVIQKYPDYQDAYYHKARLNRLVGKDEIMAREYENYMRTVTAKGAEEVEKAKAKFVEAYNNIGAHYANSDKAKAIENFNKTLALDPTNEYAASSIKALK
jgi:tetratricopeptide (TPR) repeat protein